MSVTKSQTGPEPDNNIENNNNDDDNNDNNKGIDNRSLTFCPPIKKFEIKSENLKTALW